MEERSGQEEKEFTSRLESILNQEINLDTDLMDFFLVAGWGNWGECPAYQNADEKTQQEIKNRIVQKRATSSKEEVLLGNRIYNTIVDLHYREDFKTLGDLKGRIERSGLKLRNMKYKSLSYLNQTLQQYGVQPFKVGYGNRAPPPAELKKMIEHGLEPT